MWCEQQPFVHLKIHVRFSSHDMNLAREFMHAKTCASKSRVDQQRTRSEFDASMERKEMATLPSVRAGDQPPLSPSYCNSRQPYLRTHLTYLLRREVCISQLAVCRFPPCGATAQAVCEGMHEFICMMLWLTRMSRQMCPLL